MTAWAKTRLTGWGRCLSAEGEAARPERLREFTESVAQGGDSLIAYGAGRSYGDCALNSGGRHVMLGRLDRVLAFDRETGVIAVEPGVNFARLLRDFLPRGFMVPVTPGTGFATIGGAVANDVHGKNHELAGSLGQHVVELEITLASGESRVISPDVEPALFWATVGGIGLTGILTRIVFRMKRVGGSDVSVKKIRAPDLDNFLARLAEAQNAPYTVGWIDTTAQKAALGRGILEIGEETSSSLMRPSAKARSIPVDFPGFVLNPLSIRAFNELYFRQVPERGQERTMHWGQFLYPLDAIEGWNRMYGKRGFHQFQCAVPHEDGAKAVQKLMEEISQAGSASFLAVLKRMGPGSAGYLSFPMAGYTLALDFPAGGAIAPLYRKLVKITKDFGGRVYLGKDSLLTAEEFQGMYPDLPAYLDVLAAVDPKHRFVSDMARRLRIFGR